MLLIFIKNRKNDDSCSACVQMCELWKSEINTIHENDIADRRRRKLPTNWCGRAQSDMR